MVFISKSEGICGWKETDRERVCVSQEERNESQAVEDDDSLVWRRSCDNTMPNSDLFGSY